MLITYSVFIPCLFRFYMFYCTSTYDIVCYWMVWGLDTKLWTASHASPTSPLPGTSLRPAFSRWKASKHRLLVVVKSLLKGLPKGLKGSPCSSCGAEANEALCAVLKAEMAHWVKAGDRWLFVSRCPLFPSCQKVAGAWHRCTPD